MRHSMKRFAALLMSGFLSVALALPLSAAASPTPLVYEAEAESVVQTARSSAQAEIVPGELIVKYKDGAKTKQGFSASGFQASAPLAYASGAVKLKLNEGVDVYDKIAQLEADPNVEYAQPVYVYRASEVDNGYTASDPTVAESVYADDPFYTEQWGLHAIQAAALWAKASPEARSKIVVAVLDTGISTSHEDLSGQFLMRDGQIVGANFADDGKPASDFNDYNGHGTHVAGIIGAIPNNVGIAGVASGVQLLPVRVLNEGGSGNSDSVASGIRYAVDQGADIINLSLGASNVPDPAVAEAVQDALMQGVVVIAAVGNESNNYIQGEDGDLGYDPELGHTDTQRYRHPVNYPAAYEGVIGVGAVDWLDNGDKTVDPNELLLADFSNTGSGVDLVAPGVGIMSAYIGGPSSYQSKSGTSMAAPFVSGLAALILAGDPYSYGLPGIARSAAIQRILEQCTATVDDPLGYDSVGAGLSTAIGTLTKPRLHLDWQAELNGGLTLSVEARNAAGISVTDSVYRQIAISMSGTGSPLHQNVGVALNPSTGRYSVTFNDLSYGLFWITADDADSANQLIYDQIFLVSEPPSPAASLSSGTYTGAQTVSLTAAADGAEIFYTLDNSDPIQYGSKYTGPITISKSATLKAVTSINLVYSEVVRYNYTIQAAGFGGGFGGGGGGGGFGGFPAAVPGNDEIKAESTEDGKTMLTVTADKERLLNELDSEETTEVVIDVSSEQDAARLTIELAGEAIQKAAELGKPIRIQSSRVAFLLPPGAIDVSDPGAAVRITANLLDASLDRQSPLPPSQKLVSGLYDFSVMAGDEQKNHFDQPLTITIQVTGSVLDREKLGVYYFNDQTGEWEYIGGHANADGTVTFTTSHFSAYAVMESGKTFADIQNHWAKHDIEVMAARQIAQGRGQDLFDPNATVSRAEFAALIARTLTLPTAGSESPFQDVPDDAWFGDAVRSAYAAGLIQGTGASTFDPNAPVTREAMATMLLNAYAYAASIDLSSLFITQEVKYEDEGNVSAWARTNVRLANALQLMVGSDGLFHPQDEATRAEAISILKRLMDKLNGTK